MRYVKLENNYFMINTAYSGPDLGLAKESPDIRIFD
jgi:hypothetical protein